MGVVLSHAWSAAWSTAVPTVGASPAPGCGASVPCDPAIFQANATITPTSTGPTVEASPVRPRVPRSPRGLDPRCVASPLGTEPERTTTLRRRRPCHLKVISQQGHGPLRSIKRPYAHEEPGARRHGRTLALATGGCTHDFQALTDPADVSYRIHRPHDPSEDVSIAYDDPELAIPWPLPVTTMSQRDQVASSLAAATKAAHCLIRKSAAPVPDQGLEQGSPLVRGWQATVDMGCPEHEETPMALRH